MKMTNEGLELIKVFEGFRGRAYRDPVGVWTIGYGHTSMAGLPDVRAGMVVSEAEASEILQRDVEMFARGVRERLTRKVSDQQFSALVSFAYNVGLGALAKSSVLRAVNAGDFEAVPRRLALWTKAGGRTLPGLVRRRAAEAALFVSGDGLVETRVPEVPRAKPVVESKSIWAAVAAVVLALLQLALKGAAVGVAVTIGVALIAVMIFIMRERWLKLKEEAL
jgi:GH24 family phage-related lysozyme (muramidase)